MLMYVIKLPEMSDFSEGRLHKVENKAICKNIKIQILCGSYHRGYLARFSDMKMVL